MPPVVKRTYQGRKASMKASIRPVESDPFDQLLFGPRRSPHPFSSSSEALPTPSPSLDPVSEVSFPGEFFRMKRREDSKPPPKLKRKFKRKTVSEVTTLSRSLNNGLNKFLAAKVDLNNGLAPTGGSVWKDPIGASTPIRRVHRKRAREPDADQSLRSRSKISNFEGSICPTPQTLHLSNVSAIISPLLVSPDEKFRLGAVPESCGVPQRDWMDSITDKMKNLGLAGSVHRGRNLDLSSLMESKTEIDRKSISPERTGLEAGQSLLPSDASAPFLGFSSVVSASTSLFHRPTSEECLLYRPSPWHVTRRRKYNLLPSISSPVAVGTSGASGHHPKDLKGASFQSGKTPAEPPVDCSEDFVIRRRNLQRASDHVASDSVASPGDSLCEEAPAGSKRLSGDDGGDGMENMAKRKQLLTSQAVPATAELPSPDDRSGVDSSSRESSLSRSSRGSHSGGGFCSEDLMKRRQVLRSMDPTKRDSGDIASPESSHSGVDSSNEYALEDVGIVHPKRLLGLNQGSSSGASSDDVCTRDDLMSSSEDENDEDGYGDLLSRPSDMALYQPYEPGSLEPLHENVERLDDEDENSSLSSESSAKKSPVDSLDSNRTPNMRRKASRHSEERSPTGRSSLGRASVIPELVSVIEEDSFSSDTVAPLEEQPLEHFVLQPGKKYRRSLLIIQNVEADLESEVTKGRRYHENVETVLRLQTSQSGEMLEEPPVQIIRKRISLRRSSWSKQNTPPPRRRLTVLPKMDRSSVTLETPPPLSLPLRLTNQNLFGERTLPRPVHSPLGAVRHTSISVESGRQQILQLCEQDKPVTFADVLPPDSYDGATKLGEGVYGEVFSVRRGDFSAVIKIIPVEGSKMVNDAVQKTYAEIAPELIIAKALHDLRNGASNGANKAGGFAEIKGIKLVQGCYPTELLTLWDRFDEEKKSCNDRPDQRVFTEEQQFVILEQVNAGKELEEYKFSNANIALSVFKQITYSLAVAESALCFEHRDLHWGNILVSRTTDRNYTYLLDSKVLPEITIPTHGIKGTIIDYTLSRMNTKDGPLYSDLAKDPDLFLGTGDFQFDVYRQMKKDTLNDWKTFQPRTNVRWLYYLVDKLLKKKEYLRKTAKVHKDGLKVLEQVASWIETCCSAVEVAERLASV